MKWFTLFETLCFLLHLENVLQGGTSQKLEFSFTPSNEKFKCDSSISIGSTVSFNGTLNVSGLSTDEINSSSLRVSRYSANKLYEAMIQNDTCISNSPDFVCYKVHNDLYTLMFYITAGAYNLSEVKSIAEPICLLWSNEVSENKTKKCNTVNIYEGKIIFASWDMSATIYYTNDTIDQQLSIINIYFGIPFSTYKEGLTFISVSLSTETGKILFNFNGTRQFDYLRPFAQFKYSEIINPVYLFVQGDQCIQSTYKCNLANKLQSCLRTLASYEDNFLINFLCEENASVNLYDNENITFEAMQSETILIGGKLFLNLTWKINGLSEERKASHQLPTFKTEVKGVTIREIDCIDIYPPNVSLSADCPKGPGVKNGYIRRGTTAECGCEVYSNDHITATVKWFTSNGQPVFLRNESALEVTYNQDEKNQSYECRVTSVMSVNTSLQFMPKFYDPPKVLEFTVNNTVSTNISVGASVVFYCEVEGDPPAKALINGSGLGQVKEIQSNTSVLELVLEDLQCEDSGRYFCMGVNGFEDSWTMDHSFVDVNVLCPPKVRNQSSEIPVVHVSRDKNTVFTLEIYGYPEPTKFGLKIETGNSSSEVNSNSYRISYISTVPPFGLVAVTFYDKTTRVITTYILSVTNREGELQLKFDVINQDANTIKSDDVPFSIKLGVGLGCGVLALSVVIGVAIFCVRRHKLDKKMSSESSLSQPAVMFNEESAASERSTTSTDNWLFTNISYQPSSNQEPSFNETRHSYIEPPPDYFDD